MRWRHLILCGVLLVFVGCEVYEPYDAPLSYYIAPDKNIRSLGRIALVELGNETAIPDISVNMSESLFQEFRKKQMFGLSYVPEDNLAWRSMQLQQNASYSLEQLMEIRKTLRCDAVMIGSVTSFKPYPHMAVGLQLRLIDLTNGELLWALEQIWDTTDKSTGHRMRKYYGDPVVGNDKFSVIGPESPSAQLGFVSSLKFVKFVAYETAGTFDPKTASAQGN